MLNQVPGGTNRAVPLGGTYRALFSSTLLIPWEDRSDSLTAIERGSWIEPVGRPNRALTASWPGLDEDVVYSHSAPLFAPS